MSAIARRKRPRADAAGTGIDVLFEEHAPMVLAICRYHLRDPQAAEDAAQEVFLGAHRSLLGGTRPRDAAAWLATIARNQCRRALRAPHAVPLDEERTGTVADPAEIVAERADISDVTTAIAELPARQREALVMRELWGLSYEQVAAAMHLSASAVDSLLSRARRRLSEQFGDIPKAARGALVVPDSLREQLSRLIPELDPADATASGVASGAGGTAALASLGSGSAVGKAVATGAAAVAIAVPVHATMRADSGPRASERAPVTRTLKPADVQFRARPAVTRTPTTRVVSIRREATSSSSGPGPGQRGSSSGHGSSGSGSETSGSGSSSGDSGSGSSGSSGSGSGSSGSGSGSSGSGSGSSGSGSGHSGSGSSGSSGSGSGHSGSGSGSSGSGSGSSGSGSVSGSSGSGSGSGDNSGSGSGDLSGSGSGSSGSGSSGSGSGSGSG
jgi:RNA polymerase sigma factor (sigma-70 family)